MPRSGSSRSSGIFFGAGSSAEPGGAGADDRAGRSAESFEAVRAAGREPVVAVLPAEGGERRGPGAHAAHGRAPHGVSVLREPAADAASAPRGRCRGPAPDPAAHAPDGDGGDLPAAAHERGESGAPGLPLSAAGPHDLAGGPRVVRGHHLCPGDARVFLPGGRDGLGDPARARLAAVDLSASRRWTTRWAGGLRRSSIRIRAPSSPARRSPTGCWVRACASRWTAGAASSTTSSSSGCGGR